MTEMLKTGDLQHHIEQMLRPAYRSRYQTLLRAIKEYLGPLGVKVGEVDVEGKPVFGGYFVWLELPKHVSAELVTRKAKLEENLIVAPGYSFEVFGDSSIQFGNSLRLCFSSEAEEDFEEAIMRLARVVKSVSDGSGSTTGGEHTEKLDLAEFK